MADDTREKSPKEVDEVLGGMNLEENYSAGESLGSITVGAPLYTDAPTPSSIKRSQSPTPVPMKSAPQSPVEMKHSPKSEYDEDEDVIGGDILVTAEPGKALKLSRKASQKIISRPAPLFDDLPDVTEEATDVFQIIQDCIYGSKGMGSSEHEPLDCDCSEEWSKSHYETKIYVKTDKMQAMVKIMHVVTTRTVLIVGQKWSVLMATVLVVESAKINVFSANNTPMYPSSRLKRRATDYELTLT